MNAIKMSDFYKTDHRRQYPDKTQMVYSNLTPRGSRIPGIDYVVVFGLQYFIKEYLMNRFNRDFFLQPKEKVIADYKRRTDNALGKDAVSMGHIEALHDLGYLPIKIMALREGTRCPMRVPCLTIHNTIPEFFWVTNFLETMLSMVIWGPMTSATIASKYREILDSYAEQTSDIPEFVPFQGHDFSMRGMMGIESAQMSSGGHLLSFVGTDTIPAIDFLEEYYGADCEKELVGCSVPATEHSVMSLHGDKNEYETFRNLITETYPIGIVSIVSDTWDFWEVMTEYLPRLKDEIMARDGKVVIRPDSGDPVDIICGDAVVLDCKPSMDTMTVLWSKGVRRWNLPGQDQCYVMSLSQHSQIVCSSSELTPENKGAIEILWDIFGGTINSKGYKQLDSHIGLIYGDSITMDRCEEICMRLKAKGFASTNIVLGIGSYTYQYNTRDTFGFAMKATYGVVDGESRSIWKDPKTDDGVKKSAKGLLVVNKDMTLSEEAVNINRGMLKPVFMDGHLLSEVSLAEIRENIKL